VLFAGSRTMEGDIRKQERAGASLLGAL
jgi:hypothetical protein